ncbi:noncanonical pyrimidine nucleotidase, YjjG family protein [Neptunitalea chrysea]|uniref:Noncanonical pyrimidine nucleotidase, YjjG family protein n=1 Tax=Neptunitalea chrysea TaxID=1647581 RepID=A0A9W6EV30_9FLAO|nr:YjjG family noncanonical pyrimidine nucleotidase [Neptunitalea chrysea]GLB53314.1 noncanonical pyrimidine nucleotidase, YjjG family protein [Neptunitalea chrysea]
MYRELITDVFFDLDHTLWDFEKNSALTYRKIFDKHKVNVDLNSFLVCYIPINHECWKLYREDKIGKEYLRYVRLKSTFDKLGMIVSDEFINLLADEYIAYLSTFSNLFDGTFEILKYLQPKYRLHIITNGFQEVQNFKLKNSMIDHYFECVINSEMVGVKKPNPLIFEYSLEKANTLPQKSLMIGDSLEADILGAKKVGMHTIHFNTNNEEELANEVTIYSLNDLKKYL